jgi:uncharacterized protein involved in exopolysaccharide biosynthesis
LKRQRPIRGPIGTTLSVADLTPLRAALPEQFASHGMSLLQIYSILRTYIPLMVAIAVTITVVSAVIIKFMAKTYVATTTLIVHYDTKDPLAGRDFPVEMMSSYVATQTELMLSPIVLLPVVDRLNLTADKDYTTGFAGDRAALQEYAGRMLAQSVFIEAGRGGQLLYLRAFARSPQRSAEIANAVADVYIEQDRRRANQPARERAERYSQELAELRMKATIAQDKVTEFRKQTGIGDVTGSATDNEVQSLDTLSKQLLDTQNLRRSLEAKALGEQSSSSEAMSSAAVGSLKNQLATLQAQMSQLRTTYGPEHPKVRELDSQIASTREALANETHALSANTQTELARTKELEQKYSKAFADQQARVAKLREARDEGNKLNLELESAESAYKHALDGYDQIMFAAVANHTNVDFVSRATVPVKAAAPNKPKLFMMCFAMALGLAIFIPLIYEMFFNRRLRCRDDVERDFNIVVLAELTVAPALASPS